MVKPVHLNAKLDPEKDRDIIEFLKDKNKTHVIRESIRLYMKKYNQIFEDSHTDPGGTHDHKEDGSALLEGF